MQLSLAEIDSLIIDSRAAIGRLRAFASTLDCDPRLLDQIAAAAANQVKLEYIRSQVRYTSEGNLGLLFMLVGSAIAGLSALGLWAWKQHRETTAIEEQTGLVDDLIQQGYTKDEILAIMSGRGSMLNDIMSKVVILAAIVGGVLVFMKLR